MPDNLFSDANKNVLSYIQAFGGGFAKGLIYLSTYKIGLCLLVIKTVHVYFVLTKKLFFAVYILNNAVSIKINGNKAQLMVKREVFFRVSFDLLPASTLWYGEVI